MARSKPESSTWTLTDAHREQIPAWNKKWIDIIRRTEPMTAEDRAAVTPAIAAWTRRSGREWRMARSRGRQSGTAGSATHRHGWRHT